MAYKKERPFTFGSFIKGEGAHVYSQVCPKCRQKIDMQTIVKKFGTPEGWIFYGAMGRRVKMCEGALFDGTWFTHFAAKMDNGSVSHRIAWEPVEGEEQ
jgi:hypothetical protein